MIKGTKITFDLILELLAMGMRPEESTEDYDMNIKVVRATLIYAFKILRGSE